MDITGPFFRDIGVVLLFVGYVGICFRAFTTGVGRGLLTLVFPFIGFGAALRRFPWMIWLWVGGTALVVLGVILDRAWPL